MSPMRTTAGRDWLRAGADIALRTLLAPECAACGVPLDAPTEGAVCSGCWLMVEGTSDGRSTRLWLPSQDAPTPFDVHAAGLYTDHWERVIAAFKYQGHVSLAPRLGRTMRRAGIELLAETDAVVPVPLHPLRRWRRGFNQADLLARALGPPVWTMIRRTVATRPQVTLTAQERVSNVQGAFRIRERVFWERHPRWPRHLTGLRLVLVDDVCTTGSTLVSCATLLARAGAEVVGLTAALVATSPPEPRRAPLSWGRVGRPR